MRICSCILSEGRGRSTEFFTLLLTEIRDFSWKCGVCREIAPPDAESSPLDEVIGVRAEGDVGEDDGDEREEVMEETHAENSTLGVDDIPYNVPDQLGEDSMHSLAPQEFVCTLTTHAIFFVSCCLAQTFFFFTRAL